MKNVLLLMLTSLVGFHSFAQDSHLPVKATLSETLLTGKIVNNPSQVDTVVRSRSIPNEYTLEVKARVNTATGRGLDIEGRNRAQSGFRLSLDAVHLKWTAPLSLTNPLTLSKSMDDHTIRIAVKNDSAHIYQNGAYILSQPVTAIKDIVNGLEVEDTTTAGANEIAGWAGIAPNNTGTPANYGWRYHGTTVTNLFNTANATSGVRYMDVNASSGSNVHTLNGTSYAGRLLYIRWDNSSTVNTVYRYPVMLEANTTYYFSMLHAYLNNAGTGPKTMTVGIGQDTSTTGRFSSHIFNTSGTRALKKEGFTFTSRDAGQYYITITGDWAIFSIGELSVTKRAFEPRFLFGKNYPAGDVNMQIAEVTYEDGAYAPAGMIAGPMQTITVPGGVASYLPNFNSHFVVSGKTDLHLTGDYAPLVNSTVALNSNDAWLFFDNIKPSVVMANWLNKVTINGLPAANNPNVRIAIYKNGTAIIPNGNQVSAQALTAFTQPGLAGDSASYAIEVYHDSLGVFNNKIRSFILHRGYMATLATNHDGSGYSRVFIANDDDLVVDAMPQGLDTTVSFIRIFKWDWVSKKGWAGGGLPVRLTNATWFYDWSASGTPAQDYNFAMIRHNGGWPPFSEINGRTNINHLLGFNEPDQADQANISVDVAINQWPELMKSGTRLGSPAPANYANSWLPTFMRKCDSLNYRVDYIAIHAYWNSLSPQNWYNRLKAIYDQYKRPIWITEWNNGANWTGEAWPTDPVAQFEKQYNDIKGILQVLDTTSFIERYSIYNWVENKRAMVLADTLTKAGKYYAANKSQLAFNPEKAFVHNWKLVAPNITGTINNDDYFKVTLGWRELNGELGSKYILERKIDGLDTSFVQVHVDSVYEYGGNLSFVDSVYAKATYRIKAFSRDGSNFVYSNEYNVVRDAVALPPSNFTGEVLASDRVQLTWNAGTNVRSYNLKRSRAAEGPFETILGRTTALNYLDSSLSPATTYYYVVTALNSAGESVNSTVLQLTTNELVSPAGVKNPRIASGDNRITLSWDFIYDARYEVQRSTAADGAFTVIADDIRTIRYEDTTTLNDQTYYYKVVPYNAAGRGPETAVLTGTPVFGQHVHITFNENAGKFTEDLWGAYHGTWVDTVAWVAGKDSTTGAVQLNSTARSFVQMPEGVVSTLNDFTIATWFRMPANQGNNTRLFDFGNNESTFMIFVPRNGTNVRYKITYPGANYDRSIPYVFPLNEWVHMAISQKGHVFKFYANGQLLYTDSSATVKPSDMGITRNNYLGKSQWPNDPYSNHMYDDFRIYNYGLSDEEVNQLANDIELKKYQVITFGPLANKRIGDPVFTVIATASSGLPISWLSADTSIATIDEQGGIDINRPGSVEITAIQAGNEVYNEAQKSHTLTVLPWHVQVDHLNANGSNVSGNSIRPYLKISNLDSMPLTYSELTARYWFTAENYTGINSWIDYAALGNKVKTKYVVGTTPRNGALGYVEYSFDPSAGVLAPAGNSGVIQSRLSNSNWGNFNEADDYSHSANLAYAPNATITLYRNGKLIGGTEPGIVPEQLQLIVSSQSRSSGANTISSVINLSNEGNVPVNYEDVTVRYWFTTEGNAALNYWIDHAPLGAAHITGTFTRFSPARTGADAFLEYGFKPAAGILHPLCNSGNIQFRMAKSDWSAFDQSNDYSYILPTPLAENQKITVYYKGQLISGIEPPVTGMVTQAITEDDNQPSITGAHFPVLMYPNPVRNDLNIRLHQLNKGALVKLYNSTGVLVSSMVMKTGTQTLPMHHLPAGIYHVVINNGSEVINRKIFKE